MLAATRFFFAERGFLEVDTPALGSAGTLDAHVEPIAVAFPDRVRYLHTSPEYAMKRLLAAGSGDIYQLSHVFRAEEVGRLHNPEFTLVEWYRLRVSFASFIEEALDFCRLFLGPLPAEKWSYREALCTYAEIDYTRATSQELRACLERFNIAPPPSLDDPLALLQLVMACVVEPHLGKNSLCVITDYPAAQAALAQVQRKGEEEVAMRFEIYYQGIELANGYHELQDAQQQRRRFEAALEERKALGKQALPLDEHFLAALEQGLPDCCGVAVGFDRLLMLQLDKQSLAEVLPFSWDNV